LADMVAVDLRGPHTQPVYDPASTLVYAAGRGDVAHVWVAGRRVVRDRAMVGVDEAEVAGDLHRLGDLVRGRRGV
jgi:5-methylthioadenosine/S-adenosylhomocysteine deaminase